MSADQKEVHWGRTRNLMIVHMIIWFIFSFAVHWFANQLNNISFMGFPLGFYMAAQGSLIVFVVQLFIYGLHELTEANLFPGSESLHWATEPYGPDGRYGQLLSYGLVLLPLGWLAFAALFGGKPSQQMPAQTASR